MFKRWCSKYAQSKGSLVFSHYGSPQTGTCTLAHSEDPSGNGCSVTETHYDLEGSLSHLNHLNTKWTIPSLIYQHVWDIHQNDRLSREGYVNNYNDPAR